MTGRAQDLRRITREGKRRWQQASVSTRLELASAAARELMRRGRLSSLGEGVVRLGAGRRTRTDARSRVVGVLPTDIVLVVFVEQKWSEDQADDEAVERLVPAWVELPIRTQTGKKRVAFPTDVMQVPKLPRAQCSPQELRSRPSDPTSGHATAWGMTCARVRVAGTTPAAPVQLLSCNHVVLRSLTGGAIHPDWNARIECSASGGAATVLGSPGIAAPFGPNVPGSLDAALVTLTAAGSALAMSTAYWHRIAKKHSESREALQKAVANGCTLYGKDGDRLQLTYVHNVFGQPIQYEGGQVAIAELVVCVSANSSPRPPEEGDSGAAVMAASTLLSMHIAGSGAWSYSIPSYQLLGSTAAFGARYELA